MELKYKKLYDWAKAPSKGTPQSAGYDLFVSDSCPNIILDAGHMASIDTGIAFEFPEGTFGMLRPRSSSFKKGLFINGTIDEDYRGSIILQIRNISHKSVILEPGKSYAQLILMRYCPEATLIETEQLSETQRADKGFGSTGNT